MVRVRRLAAPLALVASMMLTSVSLIHRDAAAQQQPAQTADPDENDLETNDALRDGGAIDVPPVSVQLLVDAAAPIVRGRGVSVTAGDLMRRVQDAPDVVQRTWAADPRLLDAVLDRLVADRLMLSEARRLGLERDPVVQASLERALVSRLRATVVNPAAGDASRVTLDEIRQFYETHAQRFHIPERRAARVIFFTDRRAADRVLVMARAQRRHRPRYDFRELADQHNTDPDLLRTSGEIRDITAASTDIDATLRDEVYALPHPGDVSRATVHGDWHGMHGWFVVRLLSRRPPIDRTLTESSDWIRQRLVLEHRAQTERGLLERLARDAAVTRQPAAQVVRVNAAGDAGVTR